MAEKLKSLKSPHILSVSPYNVPLISKLAKLFPTTEGGCLWHVEINMRFYFHWLMLFLITTFLRDSELKQYSIATTHFQPRWQNNQQICLWLPLLTWSIFFLCLVPGITYCCRLVPSARIRPLLSHLLVQNRRMLVESRYFVKNLCVKNCVIRWSITQWVSPCCDLDI